MYVYLLLLGSILKVLIINIFTSTGLASIHVGIQFYCENTVIGRQNLLFDVIEITFDSGIINRFYIKST